MFKTFPLCFRKLSIQIHIIHLAMCLINNALENILALADELTHHAHLTWYIRRFHENCSSFCFTNLILSANSSQRLGYGSTQHPLLLLQVKVRRVRIQQIRSCLYTDFRFHLYAILSVNFALEKPRQKYQKQFFITFECRSMSFTGNCNQNRQQTQHV